MKYLQPISIIALSLAVFFVGSIYMQSDLFRNIYPKESVEVTESTYIENEQSSDEATSGQSVWVKGETYSNEPSPTPIVVYVQPTPTPQLQVTDQTPQETPSENNIYDDAQDKEAFCRSTSYQCANDAHAKYGADYCPYGVNDVCINGMSWQEFFDTCFKTCLDMIY